jgi:transcriptional regulator with XRE-family HTH domain
MNWKQLGSPPHEELRRLLIERRQKAGLTQQQVADRLGWGQKTISKIERGSKRVTAVELVELAEALGFSAMAAIRRIAKAKR